MSPAAALKAARAAGIELGIDGDDVVLEASAPPPAAILGLLSRHKASIVTLLRLGRDSWSVEDWQVFFDERAAIAEFEGGLTRAQAEVRAFARCVGEWLNRNFVRSPQGRCLGFGGGDQGHDAVLPFGIEPTGSTWLHSRCWPAWRTGSKAEAVTAMAAMGILSPADFPDDFGKNGGA